MLVAFLGTAILSGCATDVKTIDELSKAVSSELSVSKDQTKGLEPIALTGGMRSAIRAAVQDSESYQAALAQERDAFARVGVAESVRKPQLSANGNLGALRETGGVNSPKTTTGLAGGLSVSQLLFDGGRTAAEVNIANVEALAARADRVVRGNELALQAARAWASLWQYQEQLSLLESQKAQMNGVVSQIQRMADNGMLDRSVLDSARRQIADVAIEESTLRSSYEAAEVQFERFFNHAPANIARPERIVSSVEAKQLVTASDLAPGMQRSALDLILARVSLDRAKAEFSPTTNLRAGVSSPLEEGESTDITLGIAFEYTFSDGGRRRAELEAAQARVEAAEKLLQEAQRGYEAEVQSIESQLVAIERAMPLVEEKIRLTSSEADIAKSQIATGQSNLRQLVEASLEQYRARTSLIAMQSEHIALLLTIASRTGALTEKLGIIADDVD
jgi:outer membrane protein TolC